MVDPQSQALNDSDVASIVRAADLVKRAKLFQANANAPNDIQVITLTLVQGTAKSSGDPYQINFPFQSVYVLKCSHPALLIKMRPYTRDEGQGIIECGEKDVFNFGTQIPKAFFHWDAQSYLPAGSTQTVTLLFSLNAEFKPGQLSSIKGGIKTDLYTSSIMGNLTLVAAAVAVPLSDPVGLTQVPSYIAGGIDRQVLITNGTAGILYVGPTSAVDDGTAGGGSFKGYPINVGDSFKWNNRTVLYGYSPTGVGGVVNVIIEY